MGTPQTPHREHVLTILAHDARELAESLRDVLSYAEEDNGDLGTVYFEEPLRLRLVRETLSDGSKVLNIVA